MDVKGLFDYIKSKYIIKNIFDYIEEKEFQEKLFIYSKYFQKKLNIKLVYLKEKYIKKIGFNYCKYFHLEPDYYKKDFLLNRYNTFFEENKYNKKEIENIIYDIFNYKDIKDIDEVDIDKLDDIYVILIDIDSALFELILKTNNYEKLFTIHLSQKNIDNYNLKDNYITFFSNMYKYTEKKIFNNI